MKKINNPLEFELPLVKLEEELLALNDKIASGDTSKIAEHEKLEKKILKLKSEIYGKLSPYQRVQLSRHFDRPFTLDYIELIFQDFVELHGDKLYGDDAAIIGGTAKLENQSVMLIGHQRGRTTSERLARNFGMAQPEGYRKALRLFRLAEKFELPIVCFIDTQGAYPGLDGEKRGQAEAIARNLIELSEITVPVISIIIGEGGSGGALALGVTDKILMLENACYSVITPEGCASILWGRGNTEGANQYAETAAQALKITAKDLKELGIVEEVIPEPLGGAHRDFEKTALNLQTSLTSHLQSLGKMTVGELLKNRYRKYREIGHFV